MILTQSLGWDFMHMSFNIYIRPVTSVIALYLVQIKAFYTLLLEWQLPISWTQCVYWAEMCTWVLSCHIGPITPELWPLMWPKLFRIYLVKMLKLYRWNLCTWNSSIFMFINIKVHTERRNEYLQFCPQRFKQLIWFFFFSQK